MVIPLLAALLAGAVERPKAEPAPRFTSAEEFSAFLASNGGSISEDDITLTEMAAVATAVQSGAVKLHRGSWADGDVYSAE